MNVKRAIKRLTIVALIVLFLALLALIMFRTKITNAMLFFPEKGQTRTPAEMNVAFEEVWVTAADGTKTHGWWIPGMQDGPIVLMFHGNGGTISDRLESAMDIRDLGATVYMAEYRGYGDSEGSPSEEGLYADAKAAFTEAKQRAGKRPVVVFGRSLGGAVAIHLASLGEVDGLIVESTFTSLRAMASRSNIPFAARLVAYEFHSLEKIAKVTAPILTIHGDADGLIPFEMGQRLDQAAISSRATSFHRVVGGNHNDTWAVGGSEYWVAWKTFLSALATP
jgi:fermentation-respiration switch protein FrsA (DUF1100 family)